MIVPREANKGSACCDRRQALTGLGVAAAALAFDGIATASAPQAGGIDLHHHFIPPAWINDEHVLGALPAQTLELSRNWTPSSALQAMDAAGIEMAVGSIPPPGIWYGDNDHARRLARACNEYAASLKQAHPDRFGFFAVLPLPDIEASLAEIEHAFDRLGADGVGMFTNYGKHLGDPSFAPIFNELNKRAATVYVHPTPATCCGAPAEGIAPSYIEFPVDTTRTILQWILSRASDKWPHVKLIFSHAGGYIMGGLGRLQFLADSRADFSLPANFRDEVAKFYYEVSSSADRVTMTALLSYVPPSHVVLGTDSPYVTDGGMRANLANLRALDLPKAEIAAIERGNALRLLPSLTVNGTVSRDHSGARD